MPHPQPCRLARRSHQVLDSLPLSEGLASRLVAEANEAFQLNIGLFLELDRLNGHAIANGHGDASDREAEDEAAPLNLHARDDDDAPSVRVAAFGPTPATREAVPEARVAAATAAGCPFAKYAAQSGDATLTCQRFAAAKRERERSASQSRVSRWLKPTGAELARLLVLALALLALLVSVYACPSGTPHEERATPRHAWRHGLQGLRSLAMRRKIQ